MKTDEEVIAYTAELDAKATKGPWLCDSNDKAAIATSNFEVFTEDDEWGGCTVADNVLTGGDADFIAASRTMLPDLAARLQKANERVKELEKAIADAPHDKLCEGWSPTGRGYLTFRAKRCSCWKSRALKPTP